jgi:hypothetical protein
MHFTCGREALSSSTLCPMCRKESNVDEHNDEPVDDHVHLDENIIVNSRMTLTLDSSDSDIDSSGVDLSDDSSFDVEDWNDYEPNTILGENLFNSLTRINNDMNSSEIDPTRPIGGMSVEELRNMIDDITARMVSHL